MSGYMQSDACRHVYAGERDREEDGHNMKEKQRDCAKDAVSRQEALSFISGERSASKQQVR